MVWAGEGRKARQGKARQGKPGGEAGLGLQPPFGRGPGQTKTRPAEPREEFVRGRSRDGIGRSERRCEQKKKVGPDPWILLLMFTRSGFVT